MGRSRKSIKHKRYIKSGVLSRNGVAYMGGQTNKDNAIAYCHHAKHNGYLNEKLIKQHDCLNKRCPYLHKYEEKPYWIKRQIKSALKKYHKNNDQGYIMINGKAIKCDNIDWLYNFARDEMLECDQIPEITYLSADEPAPTFVIE